MGRRLADLSPRVATHFLESYAETFIVEAMELGVRTRSFDLGEYLDFAGLCEYEMPAIAEESSHLSSLHLGRGQRVNTQAL